MPFADAKFDCVSDITVVQHIPEPQQPQALGEMLRVLKPGGRLILLELIRGNDAHIFPHSSREWIGQVESCGARQIGSFGQEYLLFDRLFVAAARKLTERSSSPDSTQTAGTSAHSRSRFPPAILGNPARDCGTFCVDRSARRENLSRSFRHPQCLRLRKMTASESRSSQLKRIIGLFPELLGVGGIQEAGRMTAAALVSIAARTKWPIEILSLNDTAGPHSLSYAGQAISFRGFGRSKMSFVISSISVRTAILEIGGSCDSRHAHLVSRRAPADLMRRFSKAHSENRSGRAWRGSMAAAPSISASRSGPRRSPSLPRAGIRWRNSSVCRELRPIRPKGSRGR